MSSTNHTQHYGLSQWEPEDAFLREDFNEDHRKIDDTLAKKCEVVFGTYQGNHSTTLEQTVLIGFTPKAVLIVGEQGMFSNSGGIYGGLAIAPGLVHELGTRYGIEIVTGGFKVHTGGLCAQNNNGATYFYIAFP